LQLPLRCFSFARVYPAGFGTKSMDSVSGGAYDRCGGPKAGG
jgi:hypothetical protein